MREFSFRLAFCAGVFASFVSFSHAEIPAAYTVCASCHGEQGQGNISLNAPALAGQQADYLTRQIHNFQQGLRGTAEGDTNGAQMQAFALQLQDESTLASVVNYLSALPMVKSESTLTGDIAAGRTVYNSNCSDCHGAQGEGIEALSSAKLAGLSDQYLFDQFKKFQQQQRGYAPEDKRGRQMQFMSDVINNDESLRNVVSYIQTLSGQK